MRRSCSGAPCPAATAMRTRRRSSWTACVPLAQLRGNGALAIELLLPTGRHRPRTRWAARRKCVPGSPGASPVFVTDEGRGGRDGQRPVQRAERGVTAAGTTNGAGAPRRSRYGCVHGHNGIAERGVAGRAARAVRQRPDPAGPLLKEALKSFERNKRTPGTSRGWSSRSGSWSDVRDQHGLDVEDEVRVLEASWSALREESYRNLTRGRTRAAGAASQAAVHARLHRSCVHRLRGAARRPQLPR
jgi:hypothetical protein